MNVLAGREVSPKMLRDDPSVLVDLLPTDPNNAVAGNVEAMNVLAPAVALASAKVKSGLGGVDVFPADLVTAEGAIDHDVLRDFTRNIPPPSAGVDSETDLSNVRLQRAKKAADPYKSDPDPQPPFLPRKGRATASPGRSTAGISGRATRFSIRSTSAAATTSIRWAGSRTRTPTGAPATARSARSRLSRKLPTISTRRSARLPRVSRKRSMNS